MKTYLKNIGAGISLTFICLAATLTTHIALAAETATPPTTTDYLVCKKKLHNIKDMLAEKVADTTLSKKSREMYRTRLMSLGTNDSELICTRPEDQQKVFFSLYNSGQNQSASDTPHTSGTPHNNSDPIATGPQ